MDQLDDLGYDPTSLVGPLNMDTVLADQHSFQERGMPVVFDPSYLRHLSRYHGGTPKKRCFTTAEGTEYLIERFLHFAKEKKGAEDKLGWYYVNVCWSLMMDRLNDYLVPFAALFAGDMLCFDYEGGGRPRVVVWLHEESEEETPVMQFVAANFDDFLAKLYECED